MYSYADEYKKKPAVDKFESSTTVEVKTSPLAQLTELAVKGRMSGTKPAKKNNYKTTKRQIENDYKTRSSWF
jgi:hypothetical protein